MQLGIWEKYSQQERINLVEKIRNYRMAVRGNVSKIIMESKILLPISYKTIWWIILMGIEHERIHLETSSVIMSRLPI